MMRYKEVSWMHSIFVFPEINSKSETNHEGNFNGNSSAKIWALNGNTDMTNEFAARIQFMQSGQGMGNQTLLSNCMNSEDDAAIHIVLLTTQNLIEISVITEKQEKALPLKLPKERFTLSYQNGKWNILELIIRRKQVWARVTDEDGTTNDINGKMGESELC
ncbi:hypothetical protein FSP39_013146 [Pinctada imbricata]|uniref:Uncharacterized protein n=1 Tax=Pinctada imbricata TaxID=66713 RepID=A0AA88YWY5_PINIB|nr:hypothetical protein FSP39_013146 [Pinctada imbricata]